MPTTFQVKRPGPLWRYLALPVGLPVLVCLALVINGAASSDTASVVGGAVVLLFVGAVVLIEIPVVLHLAQNRRRRLLALCPAGVLCVVSAQELKSSAGRNGQSPFSFAFGLVLIADDCLSFVRSKDPLTPSDVSIPWSQAEHVFLAPITPVRADLSIVVASGERFAWRLTGVKDVIDALSIVEDRSKSAA